jgi:tape measure domain-containing protein
MAKRNSVEIVLDAKDQASKEIEKAVRKTTKEFGSLNRSLKGIGLSSQEIDKINKEIKEVNPDILEKELQNVRVKLKQLGLSSEEIEKITTKLNETEKEAEEVENQVKETSRSFEKLGGIGSKSLDMVKGAAVVAAAAVGAALTAVVGAVGKVGISYNAMMEQSEIAWTTILGSAEEAKSTLKSLETMGAKTPFEFEGLDKAAKLLNMAGFEGDKLFSTLTSVGDAVSAVGGGQEELEGVSRAIFQMASKGKISAEEMSQMAERGIPAWQLIADAQGKSVAEIMKMSEQGKLMAEDVLPILIDGMGNKFSGAMDKQSQSFNGLMSTLKDNLKIFSAQLMEGTFERIKGVLPPIIDLVDRLSTSFAQGGWKGVMKEMLPSTVVEFLVTSFNLIRDTFESLKNKFNQNKEEIVSIFQGIQSFFMGWIEFVKSLFTGEGNLGKTFTRMFEVIKSIAVPILNDAIEFVKSILSQLKAFWDENGAQIVQAVKNMWGIIAGIIEAVAPVIKWIITSLWENVKGVISGALKVIMGLIKVFAGLFTGDFSKMWEGIKQLFFGAIQFVWNLLSLMFVGKILGGIKSLATGAIGAIKNMWTGMTGSFRNLLDDTTSIFGRIKDAITSPIDKAKNLVKSAIDAIKGFFTNMKVKIPMPHFSLSTKMKSVAGISIPVPDLDVDWYDKGGIFTGPQIIGVGEKRPEFVGALSDIKDHFRDVLREESNGSNLGVNIQLSFNGGIYLGNKNEFKRFIQSEVIPLVSRELGRKVLSNTKL